MIRLVAVDLDGTVLREDATPSARTVETLAAVRDAGILVAICTARSPRFTLPIARDLGLHDGYAVSNSGGTVIDLATEGIVHQHPFDPEHARAMVTRLREIAPGVAFSGYVVDTWHREEHYRTDLAFDPTPNISDALEFISDGVTKVAIRHAELGADELHRHVVDAVREIGLSHSVSSAGFIEVLGPGIDKAAGVAWVAEAHGISAAETIAFGDDRPDIPMLAWAGRGVAVGNAHPEVLAIADEVCGRADEDGVAIVLEQILAELSSSEDRR